MKYPQSEKSELLKISEHFIYSKGYGSMAQTILSMPTPPREFVKCCVPTMGYLFSKLYTGNSVFLFVSSITTHQFNKYTTDQ